MIICSCNVLSDHEVRIAADGNPLRTVGGLFRYLGCTAQCGRCAQSIKRIMDELHCHRGVLLAEAVARTCEMVIPSRIVRE
jgi:bacterioferritin-associated ferredoxin